MGENTTCVNGRCTCIVTSCNAPAAACGTTTMGMNNCGQSCAKQGPPFCYTEHPACPSPGTSTNSPTCTTLKGNYDCDLTTVPNVCNGGGFPNTLGADCQHCQQVVCNHRPGKDESQFQCNNIPVSATP